MRYSNKEKGKKVLEYILKMTKNGGKKRVS